MLFLLKFSYVFDLPSAAIRQVENNYRPTDLEARVIGQKDGF
jgi:hypothetical protein